MVRLRPFRRPLRGFGEFGGIRAHGKLGRDQLAWLHHQTMQKVEGNVRFHTAMSTAFPQPAPGAAPSPGPMKVPAEKLRGVLGIREVELVQSSRHLANRRFDIGVTMKPTRLLIAGLMAEVLVLGFTTAADSAIRTL